MRRGNQPAELSSKVRSLDRGVVLAGDRARATTDQRLPYALAASSLPSGRKYCVNLDQGGHFFAAPGRSLTHSACASHFPATVR
jgi:hypothetical protein